VITDQDTNTWYIEPDTSKVWIPINQDIDLGIKRIAILDDLAMKEKNSTFTENSIEGTSEKDIKSSLNLEKSDKSLCSPSY